MKNAQPILVVIDPTTEAQPALEKAAVVARYVDAPLHLFVCTHDEYLAGEQPFDNEYLAQLREAELEKRIEFMMRIAQPLKDGGLDVSCKAVWDNPIHDAVVREALIIKPRIVVKDTHYHNALSRALFTHTDWQLIRNCPSPLWLVKPTPGAGAGQCIVAAIDPLHEHDKPAALDKKILDEARELSITFGGDLHVVHACDTGSALAAGRVKSPALIDTLLTSLRDAHREAYLKFIGELEIPQERAHWREGSPKQVLPALAQELDARIVVLGAVARSRVKQAVVGSTAEAVLDRLPCDAIVVKPDDFHCPIEASRHYMHLEKTDAARHIAA